MTLVALQDLKSMVLSHVHVNPLGGIGIPWFSSLQLMTRVFAAKKPYRAAAATTVKHLIHP
jgi:metal-dependent hydrolase (beta-lactamase superfamily II)